MIVKLFCPKCAYEKTKDFDGYAVIEVPVPITRLSESGEYEVVCEKGHSSIVVLDNIKFELLFEMGLNAIIDSYPREAVSSFSSALERFYEFYWRVVMEHLGVSKNNVSACWKSISNFSERQIGAYVTAATILTKKSPVLLDANKDVAFRNRVIHKGYIPTEEESIAFGNIVMKLISDDLFQLRRHTNGALESIYKDLSPVKHDDPADDDENTIVGCTNILTAIDVMHPPKGNDSRVGGVEDQFQRIIRDRRPIRMRMLSDQEMEKRFPDRNFF